MRMYLLAALALVVSATGCTTLKPSHREPTKSVKTAQAEMPCLECQQAQQIQQVQYIAPQGAPAGVQQPGYPAYGQPPAAYGGYDGACPGGNCPGYGGYGGHHHGHLHNGGRYGYFNGAHHTPGYPHHHFSREYVGPQGPPTAQVAYPYYTIRGPRDFLLDNPPSIGR